jgi:hypothetical protein
MRELPLFIRSGIPLPYDPSLQKRLKPGPEDRPKPDLSLPGKPLWDAMTIRSKHIPGFPSSPNPMRNPRGARGRDARHDHDTYQNTA